MCLEFGLHLCIDNIGLIKKVLEMKKLLVILAAAGMLFAMSSCSKTCTCRYYVDGKEDATMTPDEFEVGMGKEYKNCSDVQANFDVLNLSYNETTKSGVKCE